MAADRSHLPIHRGKHGELATQCDRCGFTYFDSEITIRNGLKLCTIAREKSMPCFDETGYKEIVTVRPYTRPRPRDESHTRFMYPETNS